MMAALWILSCYECIPTFIYFDCHPGHLPRAFLSSLLSVELDRTHESPQNPVRHAGSRSTVRPCPTSGSGDLLMDSNCVGACLGQSDRTIVG